MILKGKKKTKNKSKSSFDKEKLKNFLSTSENQEGAVIALIVIVVFAIGYFGLKPSFESYKSTKISIENYKNEKQILVDKKVKLQNLDDLISRNKSFIDKVKDILPESPEIPETIMALDDLAIRNSLYITDLKPRMQDKTEIVGANAGRAVVGSEELLKLPVWDVVEIRFDVTGNYYDMKKFIKDLESNIRTVDIKNITITGGGELSGGIAEPLRMNIRAYIYYQT